MNKGREFERRGGVGKDSGHYFVHFFSSST